MSHLSYMEKLLDGVDVETKALGNIATITIGEFVRKDKQDSTAKYPVFNGGTSNTGYYDQFNNTGDKIIVSARGANAGYVNKTSEPYWAGNSCYSIGIKNTLEANWKFIYYFLKNSENKLIGGQQKGGIPAVSKKQMEEFQIPIPCPDNPGKSLAIQAEIVRILDAFTTMTAELTAELNMRKKQYNFYRDQLLSFEEGEVEWRALSEMAEYSKARISYTELDDSNYVGVESLLQNRAGKIDSTRTPDSGNLTQYNPDDILIGNIRPYLKKIWHADRVGGTNGDVLVVHPTDTAINPRYLYQVLADDKFFEYNMQHAKGAKMPRGNKPKIMEYLVPIPFASNREKSLSEQERIVTILDKFDTLTSSITEGLPREIELRQKQYEYYRDLLLSFPKSEEVTA
ncbi:MAG: restriction endonuclease subunit S [Pseudoalteromonas sp.]|nr:restriction endonuclease subunit S [Pseudoalteromonas sp.]